MQQLRNDILIEMKLGYISEHSACRIFNYIDALYLEEEKQHIINAHNNAVISPYTKLYVYKIQGKTPITKGEEYYNQTYNL